MPPHLSILLLGEGNLTFTYALVKRLSKSLLFSRHRDGASSTPSSHDAIGPDSVRPCCSILTTTFDEEEDLLKKYPEVIPIFDYFRRKTRVIVQYCGSINSTSLQSSMRQQGHENFIPNLIVFNNPHIGFEDLFRHRSLLSHFFESVTALPKELGLPLQVVLTLCDDQPFRWGMLEAAYRNGFVCVAAVPLLKSEFSGYENKRHQSDAKFPFHWMIQYYFVRSAGGRAIMKSLRGVFCQTDQDSIRCKEAYQTWLSICDDTLKSQESEWERMASPSLQDSPSHYNSVNDASLTDVTIRTCLPLLHPKLAYYCSQKLLAPDLSDPLTSIQRFSPYIDVNMLPVIYQLQFEANRNTKTGGTTSNRDIPEHLDASFLGRDLTPKEQSKLERYVKQYGKKKKDTGNAPVTYSCQWCSREFVSSTALENHNLSKHSGVDQLHPNMYARVHQQIITDPTCPWDHWKTHENNQSYCRVCDLQFSDAAAYTDHIRYLSPTTEHIFFCNHCNTTKQFVDERAYMQHISQKHT